MFKFKIRKKPSQMNEKEMMRMRRFEDEMQAAISRGDVEGQKEIYKKYHKR